MSKQGTPLDPSRATLAAAGYLCRCSATLREYFDHLTQYSALLGDPAVPRLSVEGATARFGCGEGVNEARVMAWLAGARQLLQEEWSPTVHRAGEGQWLLFDASLLERAATPGERNFLVTIESPRPSRTFVDTVREALRKRLENGATSIEDVARALSLSSRTVQRRLENEGTTFGAVSDELRRASALECLRDPQIAIKEAAFRSGFSEPSTFYRAFRRWTGHTPAGYRRSLGGPPVAYSS